MNDIKLLFILFTVLICSALAGCRKNTSTPSHLSSDAQVVELDKYNTIVSHNDGKLANPSILKYGGNSHLFVYDQGQHQVIELDSDGNIVGRYGRAGGGPGEFLSVNEIFLANKYLYVIDPVQFRISRFALNGELKGTFTYGKNSHALPPLAPQSSVPRAKDIINQPFITQEGNVLISNVQPNSNIEALYSLFEWEQPDNAISKIGDIPEGSAYTLDKEAYKEAISNHNIPAYYKPYAFPVSNRADTGIVYVIYNAYPEIAKYNISGERDWEKEVPETTELDSIRTHFYEMSGRMVNSRIDLSYYTSGISDNAGNLYLAVDNEWDSSNELWIHEFNDHGMLINRYKLMSKGVGLASIFDIDFSRRRMFVVTKEGDIRAYPF